MFTFHLLSLTQTSSDSGWLKMTSDNDIYQHNSTNHGAVKKKKKGINEKR